MATDRSAQQPTVVFVIQNNPPHASRNDANPCKAVKWCKSMRHTFAAKIYPPPFLASNMFTASSIRKYTLRAYSTGEWSINFTPKWPKTPKHGMMAQGKSDDIRTNQSMTSCAKQKRRTPTTELGTWLVFKGSSSGRALSAMYPSPYFWINWPAFCSRPPQGLWQSRRPWANGQSLICAACISWNFVKLSSFKKLEYPQMMQRGSSQQPPGRLPSLQNGKQVPVSNPERDVKHNGIQVSISHLIRFLHPKAWSLILSRKMSKAICLEFA